MDEMIDKGESLENERGESACYSAGTKIII